MPSSGRGIVIAAAKGLPELDLVDANVWIEDVARHAQQQRVGDILRELREVGHLVDRHRRRSCFWVEGLVELCDPLAAERGGELCDFGRPG